MSQQNQLLFLANNIHCYIIIAETRSRTLLAKTKNFNVIISADTPKLAVGECDHQDLVHPTIASFSGPRNETNLAI